MIGLIQSIHFFVIENRFFYPHIIILISLFLFPNFSNAAIRYNLISEKFYHFDAIADDVFRKELIFDNESEAKIDIYVRMIEIENSHPERRGLDGWIRIPRSFELLPNEKGRVMPINIEVSPYAQPGKYIMDVFFADSNSDSINISRHPRVTIDIDVRKDEYENLELVGLMSANNIFQNFPVTLSYKVRNVGNLASVPTGVLRVFDKNGQEVDKIDLNPDKKSIEPGAESNLGVTWDGRDFRGGSFKTYLDLRFGDKDNPASLQDSSSIWVLPIKKIVILFISSLLALVFLILVLYRMFESHQNEEVSD